jgi:hypothetical protein
MLSVIRPDFEVVKEGIDQVTQPDRAGYVWKVLDKGGVLKLRYTCGTEVEIII